PARSGLSRCRQGIKTGPDSTVWVVHSRRTGHVTQTRSTNTECVISWRIWRDQVPSRRPPRLPPRIWTMGGAGFALRATKRAVVIASAATQSWRMEFFEHRDCFVALRLLVMTT